MVVARRPVPGREREFERWLRRLASAAEHAPGHVQTDVHAPTELNPDDWVTVYQFEDVVALDAWLESATRALIIADGDGLMTGEVKEQVVALTASSDSVTAVASFMVKAGNEHRYAELHARLVERLMTFSGFLRSEVFEPVPDVQAETVVVFSFDTREHLDTWLRSDDRAEILAEIAPHIEGDPTVNVVGGFGGWFGRPGMAEVKRWKQATLVLLALFPTSLGLTLLRDEFLPDVGLVAGVLIGNVLGVIALTWLLMPALTKLLDPWLRR